MTRVLSIVLNEFVHDNRVLNEALSLQNNGYWVRVVALHKPDLDEHCDIEGISVHRIALRTRSWPRIGVVQILKYVEFMYRVIRSYASEEVDVVHCHDLAVLPVGVALKAFGKRNISIIYDAHEYETETNGLGPIRKMVTKVVERLLIGRADDVITVSETIAAEYARLYGIRIPKIVLNCPRAVRVQGDYDHFRCELGIRRNQEIFLYQGGLFLGRGVELVLEAFARLPTDQAVVVFMGYGPLEKMIRSAAHRNSNIYFRPAVTPDVLLEYTSSADIGISLIEDVSLSDRYSLPNKLFEYIAAGLPIICSNLPEMARFVTSNAIGVVVEDLTVESFMRAIRCMEGMDEHDLETSLRAAASIYNWAAQERVLLGLYGDVVERKIARCG